MKCHVKYENKHIYSIQILYYGVMYTNADILYVKSVYLICLTQKIWKYT